MHFKPYPANHFTHAAIDAAIALRSQGFIADELEDVEIGVAGATLRTIAEPAAEKARPLVDMRHVSAGRSSSRRRCAAEEGSACTSRTSATR